MEKKIVPLKTPSLGPGEMAQQGRAFAALEEDLCWVPNLTTVSNSSCGGANSSPDLCGCYTHGALLYIEANTQTHKNDK